MNIKDILTAPEDEKLFYWVMKLQFEEHWSQG